MHASNFIEAIHRTLTQTQRTPDGRYYDWLDLERQLENEPDAGKFLKDILSLHVAGAGNEIADAYLELRFALSRTDAAMEEALVRCVVRLILAGATPRLVKAALEDALR